MTTYRNTWFQPNCKDYGPAEYQTEAKPVAYRGYLIYERIQFHVWDVVKDGACVKQMAGPRGARWAIDALLDVKHDEQPQPR